MSEMAKKITDYCIKNNIIQVDMQYAAYATAGMGMDAMLILLEKLQRNVAKSQIGLD